MKIQLWMSLAWGFGLVVDGTGIGGSAAPGTRNGLVQSYRVTESRTVVCICLGENLSKDFEQDELHTRHAAAKKNVLLFALFCITFIDPLSL
jgi:hypothetical protein